MTRKRPAAFTSISSIYIALATSLVLAVPAHGQTAADTSGEQASDMATQDIVVTAQGRSQRLQDVPISASVVGGAALQSGNLRNLEELTTRLPAVKLTPGPASDLLNIRGIGSGLNGGFEQSVATFVDGAYRGRSRSSRAALFDIDRVEVLKGPQTTFFGNNAIAGALNITTRKAKVGGDLEYNASALYAPTDGEFALEGGVSAPLADNLGFRVAAKYFGMDGYVKNDLLGDGPHQRDFVTRASLAWQPTADWTADMRLDYGRFRDNNSFPNEIVGCPNESGLYPATRGLCARYLAAEGTGADDKLNQRSSSGAASRFELDFVEAALTNEISLGNVLLKTITSYYHHDGYTVTQLAPFPMEGVGGMKGLFPTYSPENYDAFSQEVRLQSQNDAPVDYMLGAYFSAADLKAMQATGYYFSSFGANAPGYTTADDPISSRYSHHQKDRIFSLFASATGHLADGLRLNGGLRFSSVRKEATRAGMIGIGGVGPDELFEELPMEAQDMLRSSVIVAAADFADKRRTDNKLMPSVSVQYDVTPDVMTYASYTKGFKAGGYAMSQMGDIFGPETVNAYEVGLKGSLLNRRLSFSLAAFLSDYSGLQEATYVVLPSGATQNIVGNVAAARSQGIELGLTARLSPALSLNADLSYLDAYYRHYPNAPCTILQSLAASPCTQDMSGARRAYSPKYSGTVGASLTVPVGDLELRVDPSLYFSTRYYQQATADPLTEQAGFAKVDLRMGVGPADRRWEFAVIGKNLTDRDTASFRNNIPTSPGTIYALSDRPFSVAFQFSIRQ